jgi:sugar O-acyltransferase (sialic acid O-acetyltransferase NeuD family)
MKVVIFGNQQLADHAWYILTHDSEHDVVGFTVDHAYLSETTLHGLPVVAFEEIEKRFPPDTTAMIAPLGGTNLNGLRAEKHRAGKAKGYRFISYVSSRTYTWPDLTIGENCMILDGVSVQPFARIGDGVTLRTNVNVGHRSTIGDNCFFGAHACVAGSVTIGERCFVGLNSTIRDGVNVAARCFIAAGAVVIRDTQENGVYIGVPAERRPEPADTFKAF